MRSLRPAALFLILPALVLLTGPARAAVDCGCSTIGGYLSPLAPAPLTTTSSGNSPTGKYSLTAVPNGGSIQITISRVSPAAQVLSMSIPNGSAWGFSPDDDRFSYHYLTGSIETVLLFDLTSATPATAIRTLTSNPVSSRTLFSPNGQYMFYVSADATPQTFFWIVDARTGSIRYQTSTLIHIVPGSGEDSFGFQAWGFSPDAEDRSFVFATVRGPQWVELELVNLALPGRVYDNSTILTTSGFWQFSPCGDRLALVQQSGGQMITSLFRTSDGTPTGNDRTDNVASIAFSSSAASHIATIAGTPFTLAPNTAGASCPPGPALQSFVLAPHTVNGGTSTTGTVTLNAPATGSGAVVSVAIPVQPYASGPHTVKVLSGQTSANFTVSTTSVPSPTNVTIHALLSGVDLRDSVTIQPPPPPPAELISAEVAPTTGGVTTILGLVLDRNAPTGGATVALSSNDARVTVPPSATIPAGQQVLGVLIPTPVTMTDFPVAIRSSYRAVVIIDTLFVLGPRITVLTTHEHYCLPSGSTLSIHTQINGTAPAGGLTLALTNSDPAHLDVPASVQIPAGFSGWNFDVTALPTSVEAPVTITETLNGVPMSVMLTVVPHTAWSATDLGSAADYGTSAAAVNDIDLVVGFDRLYDGAGGDRAYLWDEDFRSLLPTLHPGEDSYANAINNSNLVVGQSGNHAFLYDYDNDDIVDLTPSGTFAAANGINDAGIIVGRNNSHAFRYDGSLHDLGTLGGPSSEAMAVNASGEIVGTSYVTPSTKQAFHWTSGGGLQALALPAGMTQSAALGINASGVIIGLCSNATTTLGCTWTAGVPAVLDSGFTPFAINDAGQMVGPRNGHLTLSEPGGLTRLDLAISTTCGWDHGMLSDSGDQQMGMNALGHIAGSARLGGGDYLHGMLIIKDPAVTAVTPLPVPEAGGFLALAIHPLGANPVRGRVSLRCTLPRAMPATLELLDVSGRRVAQQRLEAAAAGVRFIAIPESDRLGSGVYFARLWQGSHSATSRVVLVH